MVPFFIVLSEPSIKTGIHIAGIPFEFILFAITLIGVAIFHKYTLRVSLAGLAALLIYKIFYLDFSIVGHIIGNETYKGEWSILLNLFGLLTGFAILAKRFEESNIPLHLPHLLPDDWKGSFVLLAIICFISAFLDNIAAAMIGGAIAHVVYKGKVHIGFLAAIVAASNAGGAGSVLGDTTTTMMWIDGVDAVDVLHATVGSFGALLFFGYFAAKQQDKLQPIMKEDKKHNSKIDFVQLTMVLMVLAGAIVTNVLFDFPAIGVWAAILVCAPFRKTPWDEIPGAIKGSVFLLALVISASLMPVEALPKASWQSAFTLGFISSIFDNIPLTKLALDQGGYDWGVLAYSVGFGGSMIWFGSSAGVALSNMYPEVKSVGKWVKNGWHVAVAYIIGFFLLLWIMGWNPHVPHK